ECAAEFPYREVLSGYGHISAGIENGQDHRSDFALDRGQGGFQTGFVGYVAGKRYYPSGKARGFRNQQVDLITLARRHRYRVACSGKLARKRPAYSGAAACNPDNAVFGVCPVKSHSSPCLPSRTV